MLFKFYIVLKIPNLEMMKKLLTTPCIRKVDFRLFCQHFLDNGFEFLYQHGNGNFIHRIMFHRKYLILCNIESGINWNGTEGLSDCYLIFEIKRVYGYPFDEFKSCCINYNWRDDFCYFKISLNAIISHFDTEECVYKSKWDSNDHDLIKGLGLYNYPNSKDFIKHCIELIDNKSIKTFLLNYYNENQ